MALSTVTVTVNQTWRQGREFKVFGTIAISAAADTYAANGLTLNLNNPLIKSQRVPLEVRIIGRSKVNAQTDYQYKYIPGTNNTDGKIKIFTGGAEVSTGAMPAGVSGDTIDFVATFLGMN